MKIKPYGTSQMAEITIKNACIQAGFIPASFQACKLSCFALASFHPFTSLKD